MRAEDPRLVFLSQLERRESRLLSWGIVDGALSRDELNDVAREFLSKYDAGGEIEDEDALLDQLEDRGLLFPSFAGTKATYRTRMAETMRLLARLRQLFPPHLQGNARLWQTASPLVGDFRFLARARIVPSRNVMPEIVAERLARATTLTPLESAVLTALTTLSDGVRMPLAGFQMRATENIRQQVLRKRGAGTIVCAGTGSGKTLAFYLPAFMAMAETLDASAWTRALAIYPRNELLKDQLAEAFTQARKLDFHLQQFGRRKLRLGTFFGSTPENERAFHFQPLPRGWRSLELGYECPFLTCRKNECGGPLVWRKSDVDAKVQRLVCIQCGFAVSPDEIVLTRERLQREPADILFTTTEMLNQRIGDSRFNHLFGIGQTRRQQPQLVLLDEVHTYSGTTGAQTALLLRRWKHASRAQSHFVGLSATLADARTFFSTLVGEPDYRVEEVSPLSQELTRTGMEYMVALRNDPAARAALLSTTIQAAMLMRRTLDSLQSHARNSGVYGLREFIFTDDLDVTNRLYFNLLDAEGQDSWGRPDAQRHPTGSLANLRNSAWPDKALRHRFGQNWELCEWLGHSINTGNASLRIGRTSSQDAGVLRDADAIVATASLEVGFNDPDVNVVIQHKAPRDAAQFVQRKGRAGRRIDMRPWTLVVLSDYGRDRLAWQSFDLLFDPELPPRELPINNGYVLRMQAVFAFFDWVSMQLSRQHALPNGSIYRDFSGPAEVLYTSPSRQQESRQRQLAAVALIENVLQREDVYSELLGYLSGALDQPEEAIEALLWQPPRSLMTAALPTLLRRLLTNWKKAGGPRGVFDYYEANNPLPEFVPGQLFGDLNLPEVTVVTPPQQRGDAERREPMPILQAMREFAPGRVSRRFGLLNAFARHWVEPPLQAQSHEYLLPISRFLSQYDELGSFQIFAENGQIKSLRCVRPRQIDLVVPPQNVRDSSNSFLEWHTQIVPSSTGHAVDVPEPSRWRPMIREARFFTHSLDQPLEVRRFATGAESTTTVQAGQQHEMNIRFVVDGAEPESQEKVGVGFAVDLDGLAVTYELPESLHRRIDAHPAMLKSLRTARYRDLIASDARLDGIANTFQRQWLSQLCLSSLAFVALRDSEAIERICEQARADISHLHLTDVLAVIFQSLVITRPTDGSDNEVIDDVQQRLQHDLADLLSNPTVIDVLLLHAPALWEAPTSSWEPWLQRKFKATLGVAILDAIQQCCPDLNADDLLFDIAPGPGATQLLAGTDQIWISETTIGGGGILDALMSRYGEDPRRFFELVESALQPTEHEIADEQLTLFLRWTQDPIDRRVADAVSRVRLAAIQSHDAYSKEFEALRDMLCKKGLFVCHAVVAALSNRVLRPGSNETTDHLLHQLIERWHAAEDRLQVEIDARVFAYSEVDRVDLEQTIEGFSDNVVPSDRRQWRFNAIVSLLWPRGSVIRTSRLRSYNPFSAIPETEYDLVRTCLANAPPKVDIADSDWLSKAHECLATRSEVLLDVDSSMIALLRGALLKVMSVPVDLGYLLSHPRVRGTERRGGRVQVHLVLMEGVQ